MQLPGCICIYRGAKFCSFTHTLVCRHLLLIKGPLNCMLFEANDKHLAQQLFCVLMKLFPVEFSWCWDGKESSRNARGTGLIPGWGRSPGEGNGNPFQCSCWEIPWTEEPGGLQSMQSKKSQTQLRDYTITITTRIFIWLQSNLLIVEILNKTKIKKRTWNKTIFQR